MRASRKGFTLIEMLVVIGIISLLSVGITMVKFNDSSQGIFSAQRSLMTSFYEARSTALTRQTEARVIIYKGKDITRKLRQVGVIYKVYNDEGLELGWVALNNGFTMPNGVFYVPDGGDFSNYVKTAGNINASDIFKSTFNNGYTGSFNIVNIAQFPSRQPQTLTEGNGDWFSYHFSADGLSMNPGARVMLAQGTLDSQDKYVVTDPYSQLGFVVRRLGITVPFSGYDEMEETIK